MQKNVDNRLSTLAIALVCGVMGFFLYHAATDKPSYPGAFHGFSFVKDMANPTPQEQAMMKAMFSGQQRQELQKAGLPDKPLRPR